MKVVSNSLDKIKLAILLNKDIRLFCPFLFVLVTGLCYRISNVERFVCLEIISKLEDKKKAMLEEMSFK